MRLCRRIDAMQPAAGGRAVTVGAFDGVHRGHAALIRRLGVLAERLDGPTVVVTFDPHPAALLRHGVDGRLSGGGRSPGFDVALLDLSLPDSTGFETVDRLCSLAPALPVVVLAAASSGMVGAS